IQLARSGATWARRPSCNPMAWGAGRASNAATDFAFDARLAARAEEDARLGRALVEPPDDRSARRTFTRPQIACAALLFALLAGAWVFFWRETSAALHAAALFLFSCAIGLRFFAAFASLAPIPPSRARWARPLPVYSLLCPLYREADIAPAFVENLKRLDYPAHLLDVKLVLEEDDVETIAVLEGLALGPGFEILIVPPDGPRTKPKALNYALAFARGDFVAVYDAEDAPHPGQLKAALDAFAAGGEALACVQAPLLIDNAGESWIASQFAAEYAIQFKAVLPFLARLELPLPLGGTSNHFRAKTVRSCGGWDAYNVTEDADLGYRLAREGWLTDVIDAPTWEEAPIAFKAWLKQRTRWIKGHMQTWLVLMRAPARVAREMCWPAFASMQLILLGGVVAAFAHAPIALVVAVSLLTPLELLAEIDLALAAAGYVAAFYSALTVAALMRDARVARAALTMPLYWPLASLAALCALYELLVCPQRWNKTEHGVSQARPARPAL
ncbi:MAG: glycosyltransferase, partial [Hyphomonadaceae bacterium]